MSEVGSSTYVSVVGSWITWFISSWDKKRLWLQAEQISFFHSKLSGGKKLSFWVKINGILLPKLFWPTVRINCSSDWEKKIKNWGWRPRIFKKFEITRTICSNSKRSEKILVTESFFNLFLEVFQIWWIRTIIFQVGKMYWAFRNIQEKLEKSFCEFVQILTRVMFVSAGDNSRDSTVN